MSAAKRLTKAGKAAEKKRDHLRYVHNRKRVLEDAYDRMNPARSYPLEFRRGFQQGLEVARAVVCQYNSGRSWTRTEIAAGLSRLLGDVPAAIVVAGDALVDDEIPSGTDVLAMFLAPRR